MVSVNVKWGKEKYDIDVDLKDEPITFKSQLFALTGVEPGRQRVMYKGKTLRDESWEGFPDLVAGANLMMMGSASALPEAPKEKVKFLEDMSENELARNLDIPAGLKNLGNTCYLNATLQCLKTVPELRDSLKSFRGQALNIGEGSEAITASVRDLFGQMDKSKECVPLIMVQVLHMIFPRFAEKDDHGHWSQQDANECWVELVRMLQQKLKSPTPVDTTPTSSASGGSGRSVVDEYMRGVSSVTMKCLENPDEPEVKTSEDFFSLSCFLAQEVKYLHSGLTARITEEIEKRSEALNRNAKYEKKQLISRLPGYLTIQMIRFYFKEKDAINAKILKDIKFTMQLDVYELCAPELQAKLMPMRDRFKAEDDRIAAGKKDGKAAVEAVGEAVPWSFPEDRGSNNSGFYQLQAILTHKGRSSNSGHYVAWVRRPNGDWIMCDDEHVTKISEEDVMKLSGGGDWHCAYILLYGPRILHKEAPESSASDPPRMDVDA